MMAFLYDILFTLPLSAVTAFWISLLINTGFDKNAMVLSLATSGFSLFCILIRHLKSTQRLMLSGAAGAVFLAVILTRPSGERLEFLSKNTWIFAAVLLGVLCFFLSLLTEYYKKLRIGFASAGCAALVAALVMGVDVGAIFVCLTFLYTLLTIVDVSESFRIREKSCDTKALLVTLSPFVIAFFLIAGTVKIPQKPYDWAFAVHMWEGIKNTYAYVSERMTAISPWDAGTPYIGFSDRGVFGGDLSGMEYTAMEISAHDESDEKLYLAGRTFDHFDGQSWTKTDEAAMDERDMDTVETLAAVMASKKNLPDLVKRVSVRMEYSGLHTSAMFLPPKSVPGLHFDEDSAIMEGADVDFLDASRSRKPYSLVYYRLNRDSEGFKELLRTPVSFTEKEWEAAGERSGAGALSYSDYLDYHRVIYDRYLEPVSLSPEVESYLQDSLPQTDTDYDRLKAIEKLLRGYDYTDSPGRLPEGLSNATEYLDYFLLEKREGYCSYFATAFVLLARSYGIPARYVQGFCVPMGIKRSAHVSSLLAHAWPEAYIDGVGWIVFDPTPGMENVVLWETAEEQIAGSDTLDMPAQSPDENEEAKAYDVTEDGAGFTLDPSRMWVVFFMAAMAGVVLFLISLLIRRIRYVRMDERQKALTMCHRCMELLRRHHLARLESETVSEYRMRLLDELPDKCLGFLDDYERIMYSGKEVSLQDRNNIESYYKNLKAVMADRFFTSIKEIGVFNHS